ncbi:hypothetical protein FUA48_11170 [Flavobacterium alkalisoli]|uniref:WD40 repeat domain-containing protein n=1 Tax=Flavobacterium alkalisoli TaxID=2602769 RepID=A0A5B9FSW2_9FLAO|nr:hypothetical protein [Flavobacterium alkalisoli]QEE50120.1 hypothetical protein FUA48_11170 [Flavobacterium alkalisoli]
MKHLIAFLLLFSGIYCYSQSDSLVSYKDMVINVDNLYAISDKGKLSVWNLNTLEKQIIDTDTVTYTAISKDRNGVIHLGSKTGFLAKLDPNTFQVRIVSKLKVKHSKQVYNIFFNSDNKMFVVVESGIYDPVNNKLWSEFKNKKLELQGMKRKRFLFFSYNVPTDVYFIPPDYAFMDSNNRIWMGKMFGEFGTAFYVFDAKDEKIVDLDFWTNYNGLYLQSVFEDDQKNVYITSGLQHFSNSGSIYKIENTNVSTLFYTRNVEDKQSVESNLFIGPGTFNVTEQKLYFATQIGIYRATVPKESTIKELELLFSPELLTVRENHAIGWQMAIKKMEFTRDNRLIYLTSINGIGVYDGTKNVILK